MGVRTESKEVWECDVCGHEETVPDGKPRGWGRWVPPERYGEEANPHCASRGPQAWEVLCGLCVSGIRNAADDAREAAPDPERHAPATARIVGLMEGAVSELVTAERALEQSRSLEWAAQHNKSVLDDVRRLVREALQEIYG